MNRDSIEKGKVKPFREKPAGKPEHRSDPYSTTPRAEPKLLGLEELSNPVVEVHRSTYGYLFYAADWARSLPVDAVNADEVRRREYYRDFTHIVMKVCAFEAFLNFVGEHECNDLDAWLRTTKKYERLVETLSLHFDKGRRPYQTIQIAISYRNEIAHGKPLHATGRFSEVFKCGLNIEELPPLNLDHLQTDLREAMTQLWKLSKIGRELNACDSFDLPNFL